MKHIDLFSGIGGFAYAIDQVWDDVEHIFCEIDPFCQQVLKKHWKGSVIYGDIKELTADTDCLWKLQSQRNEQNQRERIGNNFGLLTAGVPCQPASIAGRRRGEEDDRWLWPEAFRILQNTKPTWAIFENPCGLLTLKKGLVFKELLIEMESFGYEIQPIIIPACSLGAPHRRKRIWIIAHYAGSNRYEQKVEIQAGGNEFSGTNKLNSNAYDEGLSRNVQRQFAGVSKKVEALQGREHGRVFATDEWGKNWFEVATKLCGVDDGLPAELDGFKLTKAGHRVERLKALGNSIVPQVAIEIMKAIKKSAIIT